MVDSDFPWQERTCLVTGAFGFIGTRLCKALLAGGARVVGLDLLPSADGTFFGLEGLSRTVTSLIADTRRSTDLAVLRDVRFDVAFHLAAQPISPLSNIRPEETMETNVIGTANVGRALAHQEPPPVFVFASSACYYGASTTSPLKEEDPYVEGEYKYSESKVRAEAEVVKMEADYGMPTVRCRFVNLYGPGDRHFSRVVPKTLRHLIRGEHPCFKRDDGSTVLDFMHVDDAVRALVLSAENGRSVRGEVFNFGVGRDNPRAAREVVTLLSRFFDGEDRAPTLLNPKEPRTKMKYLDPGKAARRFGWSASKSLEEGLPETVTWYKENLDRIDHLEF